MEKNKLVLGTVQLGMPYGISNTSGQPDEITAMSILDAALRGGIDTFDTAAAYGTSEEVIGHWIAARSLSGKVRIISKLPSSVGADERAVLSSITVSLKRLNIPKLDGYLLHSPADMESEVVMEGLKAAQDGGYVSYIGVSIYTPEEAIRAAELGFEYIQIPYNVLDQRLDKCGFFELAKERGMKVFARGPLLQGLLVLEPRKVPSRLAYARPYVEKFRAIATAHGLSPVEAAFVYVFAHPGIDHIVFGVDTIVQLREILSMRMADNDECAKELRANFNDVEDRVINPSIWPKGN